MTGPNPTKQASYISKVRARRSAFRKEKPEITEIERAQ